MKRVLLFTLEYPPDRGGVATYLHALHADLPNVTVVRARSWALWPRWLPMIFQLLLVIKKEKFEFVAISHALPVGYAALKAQWLLGIPYGVFVHGLDVKFATRNPWKRWWFQRILHSARWIVANSSFTKDVVSPYVGETPILVLRPCVPSLAPREKKSDGGHVLLTVSRLVARKNIIAVIRACAALRPQFPDLTYTIVGDGPERSALVRVIKELHLTDCVTIVSDATDNQRDAYYAAADIFVLPTISKGDDVEGFGLVFLEAARHGLPVIAGRGGGVEDAVVDKVTGVLVDPLDESALEHALRRLLQNPTERARLGEQARDIMTKFFLCSARKTDLEKLYR